MKLGLLPTLHQHRRDAVQSIQSRLDVVSSHLPELGLRNSGRRKAVSNDRETGESQAVRDHRRRGWQFGLDSGNRGIHILQSLEHVEVPVEEQIDLCRSAAGDRAHLE